VDRRDALAEDLRALADDLKSLYETATTDPKERQRKERMWGLLTAGLGVLSTLVARRAAAKLWGILTGETAPVPKPQAPAESSTPAEERSPTRPAA